MSHELSMLVRNNSSYTLRTYSVSHSWNGHNENLHGANLGNKGAESASIQITSGYTQYDWYTVQFDFDKIGVRQTNFYCNSSNDQDKCVVDVYDDYVDLLYYVGDKYDTGCKKKHYSGEFKAEEEQKDPVKINPAK